jgi:DNA-binding transcriptional MocR family regulator
LLHILAARVGDHNAVVASQGTLAKIMGCSAATIKRALAELRAGNWIEVRQVGPTGSVNAYVVNDRVVWSGPREGLRYSLFTANVILTDEEQPDRASLGNQDPLMKLPRMFPGEQQLPAGPGLPPPSEPALPGLEVDLPAISEPQRRGEPTSIGSLLEGLGAVARVGEDRENDDEA